EIAAAEDKTAKRNEMIDIYEERFNNPYAAAARGYVDAVIRPSETRKRLIDALEILSTKSESLPPKKHGNIPV
ncbi:MAG: carboxyl transferase domain-containing protein, partial [Candidatus Cloacimonadaceae bacterium]|nr:carboxyl transferase domain-containing protein [Candidatus Cloacimonadaceae bacterium]